MEKIVADAHSGQYDDVVSGVNEEMMP